MGNKPRERKGIKFMQPQSRRKDSGCEEGDQKKRTGVGEGKRRGSTETKHI